MSRFLHFTLMAFVLYLLVASVLITFKMPENSAMGYHTLFLNVQAERECLVYVHTYRVPFAQSHVYAWRCNDGCKYTGRKVHGVEDLLECPWRNPND